MRVVFSFRKFHLVDGQVSCGRCPLPMNPEGPWVVSLGPRSRAAQPHERGFLIKLQDVDRVGGRWHLLPDGGAHSSREVTVWGALTYSQRGTWCLWPGGLSDPQELRRHPGTQGPGQEPGRLPQTPCPTGSGRAARSRRSGSQAPETNGRMCPEPGGGHGVGCPASGLHPEPAGPLQAKSSPSVSSPASD